MRKEYPPKKLPSQSEVPAHWAILIAIVAFAAGAGTAWLILHDQNTKQPAEPTPTYMAQGAGAPLGVTQGGGAFAPNPELAVPPDVSEMPPAQAAVALGNWNYDRKIWLKAIELYQRAISLGVDNADVRTDLGNALRFSGQPQKALEQYQIARRANPQHENSLYNTATLYTSVIRDPANAATAWKEYLRLFPNGEKADVAKRFLQDQTLNALEN